MSSNTPDPATGGPTDEDPRFSIMGPSKLIAEETDAEFRKLRRDDLAPPPAGVPEPTIRIYDRYVDEYGLRAQLEAAESRAADLARQLDAATKERDRIRRHADQLDRNWDAVHQAAMKPIRAAIGNPDATVPEIVAAIISTADRLREAEGRLLYAHRAVCTAENCRLDGGPEHEAAFLTPEPTDG